MTDLSSTHLTKQPYPTMQPGDDTSTEVCPFCGTRAYSVAQGVKGITRGRLSFRCGTSVLIEGASRGVVCRAVEAEQQRIVGIIEAKRAKAVTDKEDATLGSIDYYTSLDLIDAFDDLLAAIKERPDHA